MPYSDYELSQYGGEPLYLYRFVPPIGSPFFYTNMPVPITAEIDGTEYDFVAPEGGISHTEPEQDSDWQHADIDVVVSKDNAIIKLHRSFPPPGDTVLTIFRKHKGDSEVQMYWMGVVSRTPISILEDGKIEARIQCQTEMSFFESEGLVDTLQNPCNFFLGDGRCPVLLANWRRSLTVYSISDNEVVISGDAITLTGKYRAGKLVCSNGDQRTILSDVLDDGTGRRTLTLTQAFPATTLAVTDPVDGYRGCDRLHTTCKVDFGAETGDGEAFGGNPAQAALNPHEIRRIP